MSRKLLLSVIVVLIITNIATLLFLDKNEGKEAGESVVLDDVQQTEVTEKDSVAQIGEEEIAYRDWVESLRKTNGEKHLKTMIDRSVVNQLAKQKGIQINEKIIEREISFLTTMKGVMTKEERASNEAKWREDITYRYELEALLAEGVDIPEQEIQTFYDGYKNQYDFTASIQFSHIIVDSFDVANKVIKELEQGASFDLLAKEYSTDNETKNNGGYLGFFTETSQFFSKEYYNLASEMEEDSYSEPFNAGGGVAIMYLHRKLPSITFTYDEIKDNIKNELALNELEQSLTADPLWEQLDIEWIYGEK